MSSVYHANKYIDQEANQWTSKPKYFAGPRFKLGFLFIALGILSFNLGYYQNGFQFNPAKVLVLISIFMGVFIVVTAILQRKRSYWDFIKKNQKKFAYLLYFSGTLSIIIFIGDIIRFLSGLITSIFK